MSQLLINMHDTIQELETVLMARLKALMKQPEFISGLTYFHW